METEEYIYTVVWGAGELEQGRYSCDTLDQVRAMLEYDTDLGADGIERLISTGKSEDEDKTQFDWAWIRLEGGR